jgi:hypothetical protein
VLTAADALTHAINLLSALDDAELGALRADLSELVLTTPIADVIEQLQELRDRQLERPRSS